jgi:tRNA (mo5U34)-methyltransferase
MTIKHWLQRLLRRDSSDVSVQKHGCYMASAREVSGDAREILIEQIAALAPWFHNYELAPNVWTNSSGRFPGIEYPLQRWQLIQPLLPEIEGKSCLDVGCSSGFFSLKLKELGAAYVLGVDFEQQPQAIEQAKLAAKTLGLDVDFQVMSAYNLAALGRQFDLVLFMGVFYHLRHPLVALEAVRALCSGTMIFQTITTRHNKRIPELSPLVLNDTSLNSSTMRDPLFPTLRFVEGGLTGDTTCWFVPNPQAVCAILRSCGFRTDDVTFSCDEDVIIRCYPNQ